MKTIGVYTKNFSLYHDLLKTLQRRKIPYVPLVSLRNIPKKIGVILTSNNEIHDFKTSRVIAADVYDNVDHAVDLALQMLIGKDLYSKVYIGIDPGEQPGVAIVGDEILLQKTTVNNPAGVKSMITRFLKEYPSKTTIIRIGHGSPIIRNRIINSLISLKIPIEIVNESKTSSTQQTTRPHKDKEAAAVIAMLEGGKVKKTLPLKPTRGDIKKIQEKSRILTEGEFTISQRTALRVLNGELSLKEAIKMEKPKRL